MYTDEWELEFDEDKMAALEDVVNAVSQRGQRGKRGQSTR